MTTPTVNPDRPPLKSPEAAHAVREGMRVMHACDKSSTKGLHLPKRRNMYRFDPKWYGQSPRAARLTCRTAPAGCKHQAVHRGRRAGACLVWQQYHAAARPHRQTSQRQLAVRLSQHRRAISTTEPQWLARAGIVRGSLHSGKDTLSVYTLQARTYPMPPRLGTGKHRAWAGPAPHLLSSGERTQLLLTKHKQAQQEYSCTPMQAHSEPCFASHTEMLGSSGEG